MKPAHNTMLKITREIIDKMISHGRAEAPLEACGYLAAKNGAVCSSIGLQNVDASPVHYSMDPAEQFKAVRKFRDEGLTLRAVYHTHPETSAYPSAEDIRLAYDPDISYVIVSLADKEPAVYSFIIKNNSVANEPIEIIGAEK
jgi:proteasome lid subunit RPN8/RPN11